MYTKNIIKYILVCIIMLSSKYVAGFEEGAQLPEIEISAKGKIILKDGKVQYVPWSSREICGEKPVVFYYMPAKISSDGAFTLLNDEIALRGLSAPHNYVSVTIVNVDQAVWGTSRLAYAAVEKNKKDNPNDEIVVDERGDAMSKWNIDLSAVALIIMDGSGRLSYFHAGWPLQSDVEEIADKLENLISD